MQHNILFSFAYLNFELTSSKDLKSKVAAMHRKGVVFSKMFVLRSTGNELVPSPHKANCTILPNIEFVETIYLKVPV